MIHDIKINIKPVKYLIYENNNDLDKINKVLINKIILCNMEYYL